MCFVWMVAIILYPARAFAPSVGQTIHDPRYWLGIFVIWTEVPGFAISRALFPELFRQHQIAGQRLQNILPGANGVRVANAHRLASHDGAHDVGNEPIFRPVAATNHVTSPYRG